MTMCTHTYNVISSLGEYVHKRMLVSYKILAELPRRASILHTDSSGVGPLSPIILRALLPGILFVEGLTVGSHSFAAFQPIEKAEDS